MEVVTGFKHLGALAVAVLFGGLTLLVTKWPQTPQMTFSQHAAVYRHTILYYCALFTVALPLALLFFIGWFVPTFDLPVLFSVFIIMSCITQYICTLIPETGGRKSQIHQTMAGISAVSLVPPLFLILNSNHVGGIAKVVTVICLSIMMIILGMVGMNKQKYLSWKLQALYFAAFFIAILAITY